MYIRYLSSRGHATAEKINKARAGAGGGAGQYWVDGRGRSEGKGELRRNALGVSSETVRKERGDCEPCAKKECPKCVLTRGIE